MALTSNLSNTSYLFFTLHLYIMSFFFSFIPSSYLLIFSFSFLLSPSLFLPLTFTLMLFLPLPFSHSFFIFFFLSFLFLYSSGSHIAALELGDCYSCSLLRNDFLYCHKDHAVQGIEAWNVVFKACIKAIELSSWPMYAFISSYSFVSPSSFQIPLCKILLSSKIKNKP